MQVTIHEAKSQLSELIAAAERGEEVIISRRDKPVVRLVAEKPEKTKRRLGFLASHGEVNLDGFFDPTLDAQIAEDFYRFAGTAPLNSDHLAKEGHEPSA
jgi:prevent-host-death family protein